MSWKRYFRAVGTPNNNTQITNFAPSTANERGGAATSSKFSSYLPEVYAGHPNRIQRYYQYDDMDRDSDINAALDTIADFCTQSEEQNDEPFEIHYMGEPNETETQILKQALVKWTKINDFRSRLWHMFRNTIKNGDAFFLRDPETAEWLWIDTFMVEMVKVDDTAGKEPAEYIVRGLDYNKTAKFATIAADPSQYRSPLGSSNAGGARPAAPQQSSSVFSLAGTGADPRQRNTLSGIQDQIAVVDAEHVIHLSLSVGMDINWPFGASILEPVFKTYKQKELLEDAIIIYRVQRAPERRIFYIDTGSMPPQRAKAHIEQIKNEIHQRRIPSRCLSLETKIYLLDGRLLALKDVIQEYNAGKQNWVYSCDPDTGEVVPGKISWAGETKQQTEVVKLTLDNGETIICTPDHKFPILGKGFVKAEDMVVGESFIPLYFREQRFNKKKNTYTQIFDNKNKVWKYTHKMVADYFGKDIYAPKDRSFTSKYIFYHEMFRIFKEHYRALSTTILEILKQNGFVSYNDFKDKYPYMNHKLVSIEKLEQKHDTGTITVDGDEIYHSYHTFAIEGGIFTKNSGGQSGSMLDAAYNPLCVDLNTKIPLLDGRTLTVAELGEEHRQGKENWVFSCDPETGKIMPGPITWAGQTRSNAKVVRLTLDNGETLNCTPDHKIPVIDKGYVEAKDITPDDRLFSSIDAAIEKIAQPTHITLIKYLDEPIDVGTLTIDGNEQYHGHHNFAISSGIFIKNSINDDYYFAMGCFRLNTTVPLLDGRILTFKALIEEYDQGKVNYTYSLNTKTHEFEPGKIAWAGITRRNAEMVRVTLDNGEHADCTPDHRFIMRDGSEVHAEDLKSGDSLMPLYRKASFSGKNQKNAKYERIVSNATGKSMFTHLLVQPKPPGRDYVVHHKDFSSTNNNPDNLEVMAWADHEALHKAVGTYSVGKQWATEAGRKNMILGMRNFHKVAITSEQKEEMRVRNRVNGAKVFNGKHAERIRQQGRDNLKKVNEIASLNYTIEMFDRLVEIYDSGVVSLRLIIPFLRQDENFQTLYAQANETTFRFKHHGKIGRIDDGHVNEIVRFAGFAGWDDFRSTHPKTEAVIAAIEYEKTRNAKQMHSLNASRTMNYTPEMFMRMVTMFNQGHNSISKLRRALMNDDIYQSLFQEANCSVTINKGTGGIVNARVLTQLSRVGGYNGWDDFKSTYAQNHKVVSVVRLSEREDTADLTIESPSDSHVFALGIGVYVHNSEGRGSKVETLPGGELVGEVGDLLLWSRKLARGLRIPTSYLPLGGEEEGGATYQDGKLGAAMIQEFRFSKYCMRIQSLLAPKFDASFKWFLRKNGIEIDESLFELRFLPPQNFTKYRQIELDAQQVGVYTQLAENKKLSERFKLKRYLNLTDEELLENEKLWSEENAAKLKKSTGTSPADNPSQDLGSVGVRGGDDFDMGGEEGEMPPEGEEGAMPPEGGAPGAAPPVGSPAPGAAPTGGAPPAGGGF